jgi:hypothetical protein
MIGIYVCKKFYQAPLDNYKTVEQEGKTAVSEIRTMKMYWDVNTTVIHSVLKLNGLYGD